MATFVYALAGSTELTKVEAHNRRRSARMEHLCQTDAALDKVRLYPRLATRWEWLNQGPCRHASNMLAEMGRLPGGWQKQKSVSGA